MDRKQIISELKLNLLRISQVVNLIESYENSSANVELELLQKNTALLFENFVRLKISFEGDYVFSFNELHNSNIVSSIPEAKTLETPVIPFISSVVKDTTDIGFSNHLKEATNTAPIIEDKMAVETMIASDNSKDTILSVAEIKVVNTLNKPNLVNDKKDSAKEVEKDITLNERFSSLKTETNLAKKHLLNPITDLTKEISLNKKFAFVNELFEGDIDIYNNAISKINTVVNIDLANNLIHQLKINYKWKPESVLVAEFAELVERRWGN